MDGLLISLGISVYRFPMQIRCPVHRQGKENTPSARLYEDNSFVWCYTCHRQYKPTEVLSAQQGISREEAAEKLLVTFPVTQVRAIEILREKTTPKKPTLSAEYQTVLENKLLETRGKIPYQDYRKLTKLFDTFWEQLGCLPEREQEPALWRFLHNQKGKY
jgi:hypothetical protein